jgi:transposase
MSPTRKAKPTAQPVKAEPKVDALTVLNANAAGIDIGMEEMWVSVRADRDADPLRPFGMNTPDLLVVAEWLKTCGV